MIVIEIGIAFEIEIVIQIVMTIVPSISQNNTQSTFKLSCRSLICCQIVLGCLLVSHLHTFSLMYQYILCR